MGVILRWAGSKKKILKNLRDLVPAKFNCYHEPFAGSAVLFFSILPKNSRINDINQDVVLTYKSIKEQPDEVVKFLQSIPLSSEAYYILRNLNASNLTPPQRAARLIFLMKSCFNGVYRTNKQGNFNVPFGGNIYSMPNSEIIEAASIALRNTEIECGDFENFLKPVRSGDFVYLDPPYSESKRFSGEYGYDGVFAESDVKRLAESCRSLSHRGAKVLLSFKANDFLIKALPEWNVKYLQVGRSVSGFAHSRRISTEVLISNY